MERVIEISDCKRCPHYKPSEDLWHERCCHMRWWLSDYHYKILPNELTRYEIPNWCPLDKVNEAKFPSPWLDKPDKAGDWVQALYLNNPEEKPKWYFETYNFSEGEIRYGFTIKATERWLYIEPPEPPKGGG